MAGLALSGRGDGLILEKIVGWAVRPTIRRELVLDAITKAVHSRHPRQTLIHSDQGT